MVHVVIIAKLLAQVHALAVANLGVNTQTSNLSFPEDGPSSGSSSGSSSGCLGCSFTCTTTCGFSCRANMAYTPHLVMAVVKVHVKEVAKQLVWEIANVGVDNFLNNIHVQY